MLIHLFFRLTNRDRKTKKILNLKSSNFMKKIIQFGNFCYFIIFYNLLPYKICHLINLYWQIINQINLLKNEGSSSKTKGLYLIKLFIGLIKSLALRSLIFLVYQTMFKLNRFNLSNFH
uniref:Transmembrane protein n=1 Tax=Eustigmatophyceae sp. Chic 10/23 P-6w TaxID=1446905 RepID=A0A3R5QLQ3_9STRA|nr:hypothetical protein [Eustigmatophyceae sp. Chic 10/23 P-6w]QAA11635.1 hypothetical protein [Eustigmatophyceae sp. Chic 10/23 P-6w]